MAGPTLSQLKSELTTDPAGLHYAAPIGVGDLVSIETLLNAKSYTLIQPISWIAVVQWVAAQGLRGKVEDAANDKTNTARDVSLTMLDFIRGLGVGPRSSEGTLDVTDPRVVGATSTGSTYAPGGPAVATPGLLDAFVTAQAGSPPAAAPLMSAAQKDALINLGVVPASRAEVLWGAGTFVDHLTIALALRS